MAFAASLSGVSQTCASKCTSWATLIPPRAQHVVQPTDRIALRASTSSCSSAAKHPHATMLSITINSYAAADHSTLPFMFGLHFAAAQPWRRGSIDGNYPSTSTTYCLQKSVPAIPTSKRRAQATRDLTRAEGASASFGSTHAFQGTPSCTFDGGGRRGKPCPEVE